MTVTTVYPVRSVNWDAITLAASIWACELAEGGRVRIKGFSAKPSSTVGKGWAVSVGVTSGVGVPVSVAGGVWVTSARGKVQPASMIAAISKKFINREDL